MIRSVSPMLVVLASMLVACPPAPETGPESGIAVASAAAPDEHGHGQQEPTTGSSPTSVQGSGGAPPATPTEIVVADSPFQPLAAAPRYELEILRAAHPVRGEGSTCAIDHQCDSPLRCIAEVCSWPAAMTGDFDASAPAVVFYPSGGRPDRMYTLETAVQPLEQQRGLMHRRAMVSNGGMIFINPSEEQRNFWMRNTYLPLDIIFVRASGVIDSIQADCPPRSDDLQPSAGPAQYVIELHAGQAAEMGIQAGDRVELLNLPAP